MSGASFAVEGRGTTLAVDELGDAVSGGFRVSGFAVFDPAAPFRPAPAIPDVLPGPGDLVATQRIEDRQRGFSYPDDVR